MTRLRKKEPIPRVYKSAFGGYYILKSDLTYSQDQLKEAYEQQNREGVSGSAEN